MLSKKTMYALTSLMLLSSFLFGFNPQATGGGSGGVLAEMESLAKLSPEKGNIFQAMLYEYGYEEEGIAPDAQKAIEFYERAYAEKSPIAAFKLAMHAWGKEIEAGAFAGAPLEYFSNGMKFEPKDQALLNRIAGGIYLHTVKEHQAAIDVLSSAAKEHHATAQLYVAFSYLELGNIAQANTYLSLACTNRVQNPDIASFCTNGEFVEKVELGKKGASLNEQLRKQEPLQPVVIAGCSSCDSEVAKEEVSTHGQNFNQLCTSALF